MNLFSKKNRIKNFFAVAILFAVIFLNSGELNAISMADIEFLISIGVIPADQADFAREAVNAANQQAVGSALTTDPTSGLDCLVFNQTLVKGQSGTVVSALQKFLQRLGHFPKTETISGFYGDVTKKAVSDFQIAQGLITSSSVLGAGAVGPITRAKIQEVSCNQAASLLTSAPAPAQTPTTPTVTTTAPASVSQTKPYVKPTLTLRSSVTYENEEAGTRHFKYDMKVVPNDSVKYFDLTLVCDSSFIKTNRQDLNSCGQTLRLKPSTQGTKSLKIGFTNLSKAFQNIGLGLKALDSEEKVLDFVENVSELPAPKPVTYISQTLVDGKKSTFSVPKDRNCDPNEQLEFMKYIMTITPSAQNSPLPPTCWPGNIMCDTNINYPPTYCMIPNGPTSDDLCSPSQRFYNGKCVNRSTFDI